MLPRRQLFSYYTLPFPGYYLQFLNQVVFYTPHTHQTFASRYVCIPDHLQLMRSLLIINLRPITLYSFILSNLNVGPSLQIKVFLAIALLRVVRMASDPAIESTFELYVPGEIIV